MTPIQALAVSAASYLLVSFAIALVTATLLVAAEELGARRLIHRAGVRNWLAERHLRVKRMLRDGPPSVVPNTDRPLPVSDASYALPYRQLVAVIGSLVQADLRSGAPYPLAYGLSLVGRATMADFDPSGKSDDVSSVIFSGDSTEADLLFFAERALDDLQAYLALYTVRARYALSLAAVSMQVFALWLQGTQIVAAPILGSMLLYPISILAAVLFAPVLRDALQRLSQTQ